MSRSSSAHFPSATPFEAFSTQRTEVAEHPARRRNVRGPVALLAVVTIALGALLQACGSSGASSSAMTVKTGHPQRVRWIGYTRGQKFELVNVSHTDRTELYSKTRRPEEAFTKVTSDEVLDEIVNQYRSGGFFEHARPGPAPESAVAGCTQAIEVDDGGKVTHWAPTGALSADDAALFSRCRTLLLTVYTETLQLQSVDKSPDFEAENRERLQRVRKKSP